jgi:hypothetical protein
MTEMPDFDDVYGSKYFGIADLKGEQSRLKIGKVAAADLREKDGSTKVKYVVYFEGQDKGLVLNKTNAIKLADAYGKKSSAWVGQVVELYGEMTGLGKEGVRLRPLRKPAAPAATDPELSDAIPF